MGKKEFFTIDFQKNENELNKAESQFINCFFIEHANLSSVHLQRHLTLIHRFIILVNGLRQK